VRVITCTHTPRRWGQLVSAGDFDFTDTLRRPFRINWLIVGIFKYKSKYKSAAKNLEFRATKNPLKRVNTLSRA